MFLVSILQHYLFIKIMVMAVLIYVMMYFFDVIYGFCQFNICLYQHFVIHNVHILHGSSRMVRFFARHYLAESFFPLLRFSPGLTRLSHSDILLLLRQ